jgi:hypothetical protein
LEQPRISRTGHELPSPRVVSAHVHRDEGFHDHAVTVMLVAWGQAIDHDITFASESKSESHSSPAHLTSVSKINTFYSLFLLFFFLFLYD